MIRIWILAVALAYVGCQPSDSREHADLAELAPASVVAQGPEPDAPFEPRDQDGGVEENPPPQATPSVAPAEADTPRATED